MTTVTPAQIEAARIALAASTDYSIVLIGADGRRLLGSFERAEYIIEALRPLVEAFPGVPGAEAAPVTPLQARAAAALEVMAADWEAANRGAAGVSDKPDILSLIMDYESGQLDDEQTIALFQTLIDNGMISQLQGHYQRTAHSLVQQGLVTPPKE